MKKTRSERIFDVINYIALVLLAVCIIVPLVSVVMSSFVSAAEIGRRGEFILWPEDFVLDSYSIVFRSPTVWNGYKNTLFVITVGTTMSMLMTILMAYPLSKKKLRGRNAVTAMVFFTMIFSGGTVPTFLVIKELGLIDTRWALVVPSAISAWNMMLMRNFFYSVPEALEEAAYLDGANQVQILLMVFLPLSIPSLVTIGMFYGVGYWNAWWPGVMYLNTTKYQPVQNAIRTIVNAANAATTELAGAMDDSAQLPPSHALKCATIVTGTVPILVVYPFIQKYFVQGVMVGSVKG